MSGGVSGEAGAGPAAPGRCPECGTVAVPRCAECGYDLSGILSAPEESGASRCPECGAAFDPKSVRVLPDLPGFWRLCWVTIRPALAYLALVLLVGMLMPRRSDLWVVSLGCLGPPMLMSVSLLTVVGFTNAHYVDRERWWVVFVMLLGTLAASAVVGLACSLGFGRV